MNFISNVLDSIPVVGHVKGVIHYATGDTEGGNKAMYQSTRTSAVLAGGAVGCVAGPAGAALGGVYGGLITDGFVSVVKDEPVGIIQSTSNIGKDIATGKAPIASIGSATFQIAMDGIGGLGMGGVSSAVTKVPEKVVTNTVENTMKQAAATVGEEMIEKSVKLTAEEMAKMVTKKTSEKVLDKVLLQAAKEAQVVLVTTHVGMSASKRTEDEIREEKEKQRRKENQRKEREQREEKQKREEKEKQTRHQERQRKEKERGGTGGTGAQGPSPPQGNKDNNKKSEEAEDYLKEFDAFITLLKKLFISIYGVLPPEFNKIFGNLSKGQKKYLVKILNRIQKDGMLNAVLELVIKTFKEHFSTHMSFTNFLSFAEFIQTYLGEELNTRMKINRSATRPALKFKDRKKLAIQDIISQKNVVKIIADMFNQFIKDIKAETSAPNNIVPDFRDIFSAVYHYFKHRCVPGDGVLTVNAYYNLIKQLLEKLKKSPEYTEVQTAADPRTIVCEIHVVIYGRMFRIVVNFHKGEIVLSSAYVVTTMCVDVEKGNVIIEVYKDENNKKILISRRQFFF